MARRENTPQKIISCVFVSCTLLHFPLSSRTKRLCQSCFGTSVENNENSLLIRAPIKKKKKNKPELCRDTGNELVNGSCRLAPPQTFPGLIPCVCLCAGVAREGAQSCPWHLGSDKGQVTNGKGQVTNGKCQGLVQGAAEGLGGNAVHAAGF